MNSNDFMQLCKCFSNKMFLSALSLIACAIIEGEKSIVDESTYDDALAEELNEAEL